MVTVGIRKAISINNIYACADTVRKYEHTAASVTFSKLNSPLPNQA